MGPIGIWEIVAVAVVALIVLGPRRLPEAARQLGKWTRQFKDHSQSVKSELSDAIDPNDLREITSMQRDLKEAMSLQGVLDVGGIDSISSPAAKSATAESHGSNGSARKAREASGEDEPTTRRLPGADVTKSDADTKSPEGTRDEVVTRRLPGVSQ